MPLPLAAKLRILAFVTLKVIKMRKIPASENHGCRPGNLRGSPKLTLFGTVRGEDLDRGRAALMRHFCKRPLRRRTGAMFEIRCFRF
jgi:hypothetical protein